MSSEKKQGNNKKRIIIMLIEVVLIVGFLIASGKMIGAYNDPEKVADRYFDALKDNDFEAAYNLLDMEDMGTFASKEAYIEQMKEDFRKAKDYNIDKISRNKFRMDWESNEGYCESEIRVTLQDEKKFFIFKQYKVRPQNLFVEDVIITVPKEITVKLEGVELDKSYEIDNSDELMSGLLNDYEKAYKIDKMYAGTYTLELSGDAWQPYTSKIVVSKYETSFYPELPYLSPDVVRDLTESSAGILSDIYSAGIAGEESETITASAEALGTDGADLLDDYDYFKSNLEMSEGSYYNNISFENVVGEILNYDYYSYVVENNNKGYLTVDLDLSYDYSYKYTELIDAWWIEASYYGSTEDYGSDTASFSFAYIDGEWVLYDMYVYDVTY